MAETIVALATAAGRSGIGVIRLSGAASVAIAERLCAEPLAEPRVAALRRLREPVSGEPVDEAVATYFKAPHSFTGEDVVELSCHGSPVVLRQVIDICLQSGARMAEAGEFSLRALANGRMDLAETEAVRDLIDAQTAAAARQAVRQMRGEFSHQLEPIKEKLLGVVVVLESALEFVEDDLPDVQADGVRAGLAEIAGAIARIATTFRTGHLIRDGLRVALVGRPNVGKSSLFNALVGSDRAIVTDIAGTTRDQISERFIANDIPVSLIDTAGIRETTDTVESIGVERSRRTIADVDLVVVIIDSAGRIAAEDREILDSVRELRHIVAVNKIDTISDTDRPALFTKTRAILPAEAGSVFISAKTGEGIEAFKSALLAPFLPTDVATAGFLVTDARHHDLLTRAESEIRESLTLLEQKMSEEIVLVGLHNALRYLGEITGETTSEDMLTRIFATFCIGK